MAIVRASDGYIDQSLHDEFWDLMPSGFEDEIGREIARMLTGDVAQHRHNFIEESWLSARASLEAGRLVRSPGYLAAREAVLNASSNPGYQATIAESVENGDMLIEAAATGRPLQTRSGPMYVNLDLVEEVVASIEASEERVRRLIRPEWDEGLREYRYPDVHVAILAASGFVQDQETIQAENGMRMSSTMISQTLSSDVYRGVQFLAYPAPVPASNVSVLSIARSAIEGAGAVGARPIELDWRDMRSATARGVAETSEGDFHVAVRVVHLADHNGVLQFMVVSQISAADALMQLGDLEDATTILR